MCRGVWLMWSRSFGLGFRGRVRDGLADGAYERHRAELYL